MLKGLPASGKSTYAKKLAESGYTRVNKDDLRSMLHNSKWTRTNETEVLVIRDLIIDTALKSGKSVVVDDTNLSPKHPVRLKTIAKANNTTFETKFFDESVEVCIKRDLQRTSSVGEKVIRDMYNQFLKPESEVHLRDIKLPFAIICDIDGTLAHMKNRSPFEWSKVGNDRLDEVVAEVALRQVITHKDTLILVSGRDESCRQITEDWLDKNGIVYDELHMRKEGDMRKDTIIKKEIYDNCIRGKYNIRFVLDDRNQIVDMWRSLGLKCLQVAEGDF